MKLPYTHVYTSIGSNARKHILDWGKDNLIYYGASHSIAIYDPKEEQLIQTLLGHTDLVTSVRWCDLPDSPALLTTSNDKSALVWTSCTEELWRPLHVLTGHQGAVQVADMVALSTGGQLVVTAGTDPALMVWETSTEGVSCKQTISLGSRFVSDIRLHPLPGHQDAPLLAAGGDTRTVDLYVRSCGQFVFSISLTGHETGINSLAFLLTAGQELLLASAAKDEYFRIWRISSPADSEDSSVQVRPSLLIVPATEDGEKELVFHVRVDSVLYGHEDAIFGVCWNKATENGVQLLTASFDQTMVVWEQDPDSGAWLQKANVGAVGGTYMGFYGGVFSPDGRTLLGHSHHAAFHLWHFSPESESWEAGVAWGGHSGPITDLAWEPTAGHYLLSCGLDQTTRLHGRWKRGPWKELARPQVHGYDMACLAPLSNLRFVSAGEEKVLRVFEATSSFLANFRNITATDVAEGLDSTTLAEGANVPSLGLTNKAVFRQDLDRKEQAPTPNTPFPEVNYRPLTLQDPPSEDLLQQNTLWPEIQKLYGHGYEVFSVAASPDGSLIASSSRGKKKSDCDVLLWQPDQGWRLTARMAHHSLTVTRLAFQPPHGKLLLSVSRDRHWALYSTESCAAVACTDRSTGLHSRIIWDCAWSHDGKFFATVSRDCTAIVWGKVKQNTGTSTGDFSFRSIPLDLGESVTSVAFAPAFTSDNRYLLALGLESGVIQVYSWQLETGQAADWSHHCIIPPRHSHHLAVSRLQFSPLLPQPDQLLLASGGKDGLLRIYSIPLP